MSGRAEPMRVFPARMPGLAAALAEEPIEIDGMRVLFDQPVALQPVTLQKPAKRRAAAPPKTPSRNRGRPKERPDDL